MNIVIYYLNFATVFSLVILNYILFKSNKNRFAQDFLIINTLSLISFICFVFGEYSQRAVFYKLNASLDVIGLTLIMFLVYEAITQKSFKLKIHFLISSIVLSFISFISDVFLKNLSFDLSRHIFGFIFLILSMEIIFILLINLKKISNETKTFIIRLLIFMFLTEIFGSMLSLVVKTPKGLCSKFLLNLVLLVYMLGKVLSEIEHLRGNHKEKELNHFKKVDPIFNEYNLTEREREVALLVLKGKSNPEIANELFISVNTVKIHVYNLFKKFEVNKRSDFKELMRI